MRAYAFLLTYSVSPSDNDNREHQNHAVRVRQKLNRVEIENWIKLEDVETAFKGIVHLSDSIISKKREEAETHVRDELKAVMRSLDAYFETRIDVVMMVQGLGETIEFHI